VVDSVLLVVLEGSWQWGKGGRRKLKEKVSFFGTMLKSLNISPERNIFFLYIYPRKKRK